MIDTAASNGTKQNEQKSEMCLLGGFRVFDQCLDEVVHELPVNVGFSQTTHGKCVFIFSRHMFQ